RAARSFGDLRAWSNRNATAPADHQTTRGSVLAPAARAASGSRVGSGRSRLATGLPRGALRPNGVPTRGPPDDVQDRPPRTAVELVRPRNVSAPAAAANVHRVAG